MTKDVLLFAADALDQGQGVALITVAHTHGSSPASPGQIMAVLADGTSTGTVGGGTSEHRLATQAARTLQENGEGFSFSFDHSEDGMVCGGGMEGTVIVLGHGPRLLLFGGGHVAQCIAPLAAGCGFNVSVVEDRPDFESQFENAKYLVCTPDAYAQTLTLTPDTYVVICTRGHHTDDDALHFILSQPHAYLGMIGSRRKVATLFDSLRKEGVPEDTLHSIYTPIGLNVASASPAEIAIAVMAEILLVKNGGSPQHKRDM